MKGDARCTFWHEASQIQRQTKKLALISSSSIWNRTPTRDANRLEMAPKKPPSPLNGIAGRRHQAAARPVRGQQGRRREVRRQLGGGRRQRREQGAPEGVSTPHACSNVLFTINQGTYLMQLSNCNNGLEREFI